jgi:hypothetical protein
MKSQENFIEQFRGGCIFFQTFQKNGKYKFPITLMINYKEKFIDVQYAIHWIFLRSVQKKN